MTCKSGLKLQLFSYLIYFFLQIKFIKINTDSGLLNKAFKDENTTKNNNLKIKIIKILYYYSIRGSETFASLNFSLLKSAN